VVPEVPVDAGSMTTFRADRFPDAGPSPWLDQPDALVHIGRVEAEGSITPYEADQLRKWVRDGYVIEESLLDGDSLDRVWSEYEAMLASGALQPSEEPHFTGDDVPGRVLDPHKMAPAIARLMGDPRLRHVTELLLGARSIPFQSISGHKASQQATHSDSIHMTTYPEGYLVAMWIAFEDIAPGSGPLVYYPGSHRLGVLHAEDVGISTEDFKQWGYREFEAKYTPTIAGLIESEHLRPSYFHAKRGDVLFWHANLLHGGSARTDFSQTRKALVFHFFAEGCICYHDLRGQLAWANGRPLAGAGPGRPSVHRRRPSRP